jgi:hypothetical protein
MDTWGLKIWKERMGMSEEKDGKLREKGWDERRKGRVWEGCRNIIYLFIYSPG